MGCPGGGRVRSSCAQGTRLRPRVAAHLAPRAGSPDAAMAVSWTKRGQKPLMTTVLTALDPASKAYLRAGRRRGEGGQRNDCKHWRHLRRPVGSAGAADARALVPFGGQNAPSAQLPLGDRRMVRVRLGVRCREGAINSIRLRTCARRHKRSRRSAPTRGRRLRINDPSRHCQGQRASAWRRGQVLQGWHLSPVAQSARALHESPRKPRAWGAAGARVAQDSSTERAPTNRVRTPSWGAHLPPERAKAARVQRGGCPRRGLHRAAPACAALEEAAACTALPGRRLLVRAWPWP